MPGIINLKVNRPPADYPYPVDIKNLEECIRIAREHQVDGVLTVAAEAAVRTVAAVAGLFIVQKQQEQKRTTSKLEVALIEQEIRDYVLSQKPQYLLQALHLMDDPRFRVAYAPKAEFNSVGDSSCAPDIAWSLVVFERVPD